MNLPQFKRAGARTFGEALFRDMVAEIRQVELDGATVLVAGFDSKKRPHIFSSDIGTQRYHAGILDHDPAGFYAIGEGAWAALGWLHTNDDFRFSDSFAHVAYRLCEAKYAAENARSVGARSTVLAVHFSSGAISPLMLSPDDPPRKSWEAIRNADPSGNALDWLANTLAANQVFPRSSLTLPASDQQQTEHHVEKKDVQ
jgi:hypothetical protein